MSDGDDSFDPSPDATTGAAIEFVKLLSDPSIVRPPLATASAEFDAAPLAPPPLPPASTASSADTATAGSAASGAVATIGSRIRFWTSADRPLAGYSGTAADAKLGKDTSGVAASASNAAIAASALANSPPSAFVPAPGVLLCPGFKPIWNPPPPPPPPPRTTATTAAAANATTSTASIAPTASATSIVTDPIAAVANSAAAVATTLIPSGWATTLRSWLWGTGSPAASTETDPASTPGASAAATPSAIGSAAAAGVKPAGKPTPRAPPPPPPRPPHPREWKSVVIIGVHGWALAAGSFESPAPYSVKFCALTKQMVAATLSTRFGVVVDDAMPPTAATNVSPPPPSARTIKTPPAAATATAAAPATVPASGGATRSALKFTLIPLVGHGLVEKRAESYYDKLSAEYKSVIASADCVIVTAHSQGVVSSVLLLARMLHDGGWLNHTRQVIGLIALAGVHLGPYPDIPSDRFNATTELFTLGHAWSTVSRKYSESIVELLRRQIKIFCAGSWGDGVVPLHSALLAHVHTHATPPSATPFTVSSAGSGGGVSSNLLRAIFIDQSLYRDSGDFVTNLLLLALHALNAGASDCSGDVIAHLSGFVRGSILDRNATHTSIHSSLEVYKTGVEFVLSEAGHTHSAPLHRLPFVDTRSAAFWSSYFTDGFTHSSFNRHMLQLRVTELLTAAGSRLGLHDEAGALITAFELWSPAPKSKSQKLLKEALTPVFSGSTAAATATIGMESSPDSLTASTDTTPPTLRSKL